MQKYQGWTDLRDIHQSANNNEIKLSQSFMLFLINPKASQKRFFSSCFIFFTIYLLLNSLIDLDYVKSHKFCGTLQWLRNGLHGPTDLSLDPNPAT